MKLNHRFTLRVAADAAFVVFCLFSVGAILWMADEFLGWDVLPGWIEKYAQVLILTFGIAAALAVTTSVLFSFVLHAEAAAERAGISDSRVSRRGLFLLWGWALAFGAVLVVLYQVDVYRKARTSEIQKAADRARFDEQVGDLAAAVTRTVPLVTTELKSEVLSGMVIEGSPQWIRFLSAVRASTAHHPAVSLLVPAPEPYRYCRLNLVKQDKEHATDHSHPYILEKQFFMEFPADWETAFVERLFAGKTPSLDESREGEAIVNSRPSAWKPIPSEGKVIALLVLISEQYWRWGFFHGGD